MLAIPKQQILSETDSPYMAPVPLRGTVNTPFNVRYVLQKLAEIWEVTFEDAENITTENCKRFFPKIAAFVNTNNHVRGAKVRRGTALRPWTTTFTFGQQNIPQPHQPLLQRLHLLHTQRQAGNERLAAVDKKRAKRRRRNCAAAAKLVRLRQRGCVLRLRRTHPTIYPPWKKRRNFCIAPTKRHA